MDVLLDIDTIGVLISDFQDLKKHSDSDISKKKIFLFTFLDDIKIEQKKLYTLLEFIRKEEQKINNKQLIKNLRIKESSYETVFIKELNHLEKKLTELFKSYELQKDSNNPDEYILREDKVVKELESILQNVLDSRAQVILYAKKLSLLNNDKNSTYLYQGIKVPSNIKLLSPISEFDLGPFLEVYKEKYQYELNNMTIQLKYAPITKDFMQSQFSADSVLKNPENRTYIMLISNNTDRSMGIIMSDLSFEEKKGWFGHELGHILAYSTKSKLGLVGFSLAYVFNYGLSYIPFLKRFSYSYLQKIEQETDSTAIAHGVGLELTRGSKFVFEKAPDFMKERYSHIYSPTHVVIDKTSKQYFDKLNHKGK